MNHVTRVFGRLNGATGIVEIVCDDAVPVTHCRQECCNVEPVSNVDQLHVAIGLRRRRGLVQDAERVAAGLWLLTILLLTGLGYWASQ